jgi:Domain of unknown function (DUF5666)
MLAQAGGGQQRPMPGPGLPFPKRKKPQADADPDNLIALKGMLRKINDKQFVIETDDKRLLTVQRTAKTKFLEREADIKPSELQPGDRLRVDATETDDGRFLAFEVLLSKRGTPEDKARARVPVNDDEDDVAQQQPDPNQKAGAGDKAKAAATPPPPAEPVERPTTAIAPPDASSGRGSDDTPRLSRGKPKTVRKDSEKSADEPVSAEVAAVERPSRNNASAAVASTDDPVSASAPSADRDVRDSFIEKARDSAENFRETLPNYSVKQFTTRFQAQGGAKANFQPIDNVSTDVVYENGKESYKNILVNGKAPKGKLEEGGSWSTGEFGTVLRDVFHPATNADFRPSGNATIVNRSARIYKFVVEQENSHWRVSTAGQSYFPAYKGTVWIDKETSRVLRIEMQTRNVPKAFPLDTVESVVDYDFVRISGTPFLLPVHSENLTCVRGTSTCMKNVIDFRNYRKFGSESTIIFTPETPK